MFSFSKYTPMPFAFRSRTVSRQSTVFLAKRERDLVMMRSMCPRLQAVIILLNCVRFFRLVPEMPSSESVKRKQKDYSTFSQRQKNTDLF